MSEQRASKGPIAWEAEAVRFSAFPPPSVSFELRPIWEQLVGRPPDEVTERPQQGSRQETGPLGDQHLFILQQLLRIDIVFGVHPSKLSVPEFQLVSTGLYERAAAEHAPIIRKWLAAAPTLGRIAYAPVLIHRVQSKVEGYRVLQELLPRLPIDPINSQDLVWQINRPRTSTVIPDLRVNRFSKWSVIQARTIEIMQGPGQLEMVKKPTSDMRAVRLELDIFTDPIKPLPSEELSNLFDELQGMSHEMMERGDLP